jgi:alpha-aminoadipic semialdehyde synthase
MISSLWSLGQRLEAEGMTTPLAGLEQARQYSGLDEARRAIHAAGERIAADGLPPELCPFIIGITGYGHVAGGAQEILAELPTVEIGPDDVATLAGAPGASNRVLYRVTYREEDLVEPIDQGMRFDLQDYYRRPERYRSRFEAHLPHLGMLINCNYWDERYPRLLPLASLERLLEQQEQPRLKVIGDLACDIHGSIECTVRATEPGDPVYVYDPVTRRATSGFTGRGPVVLAVDILPAELPRDASAEFSTALEPFVEALATADLSVSFDRLELPPEIRGAIITHRGRLTRPYEYLEQYLKAS